MARMKTDASLDEQIEKAQERLDKAKANTILPLLISESFLKNVSPEDKSY